MNWRCILIDRKIYCWFLNLYLFLGWKRCRFWVLLLLRRCMQTNKSVLVVIVWVILIVLVRVIPLVLVLLLISFFWVSSVFSWSHSRSTEVLTNKLFYEIIYLLLLGISWIQVLMKHLFEILMQIFHSLIFWKVFFIVLN